MKMIFGRESEAEMVHRLWMEMRNAMTSNEKADDMLSRIEVRCFLSVDHRFLLLNLVNESGSNQVNIC